MHIYNKSLTELRNIVRAGKTAENNIQIGDLISIGNKHNANVVAIGKDYITCITFVGDFKYYEHMRSIRRTNDGTINKRSIVGYPNSDLKEHVDEWFNKQSKEFKSIIKETKRTYEMHLLYKDFNKPIILQTFYGFEEITEKCFIPSWEEIKNIQNFCGNIQTSTPCEFKEKQIYVDDLFLFGKFHGTKWDNGEYDSNASVLGFCEYGTYVMFNIG